MKTTVTVSNSQIIREIETKVLNKAFMLPDNSISQKTLATMFFCSDLNSMRNIKKLVNQ